MIVLPSNKTIDIEGIKEVSCISLIDYPDVFVEFYYTFDIIYEDKPSVSLFYHTRQAAENDKKFILIKNLLYFDYFIDVNDLITQTNMKRVEIKAKLMCILREVFGDKATINEKTDLIKNLYATQDNLRSVLTRIEESFEIRLLDDEVNELFEGNVKHIIEYIYDFLKPFEGAVNPFE